MIPKKIHFTYGLTENFAEKPFSFFHYVAVASAKKCNNCEVLLHVKHVPRNNEWWEKTTELVTMVPVDVVPDKIYGKDIFYPEHRSDILRYQILQQYGGIYLDIDTICHKPFDDLLEYDFVLGIEEYNRMVIGLCNAVILSSPNNGFLQKWYEAYKDYDPRIWDQMSVRKPYELSSYYPTEIHIEPSHSFFRFDWINVIKIFMKENIKFTGYVIHLWESKLYDPLLRHITLQDVMTRDCLYNSIARQYV